MEYKELRKQFETEKQYPSWNCNDTVIMEYIEWLERQVKNLTIPPDRYKQIKKRSYEKKNNKV